MERIQLFLGFLILMLVGPNRFHYLAQRSGIASKVAKDFCENQWLVNLVNWHKEYLEGKDRDRISDYALKLYSGKSLGGWGEITEETVKRGDRHLSVFDQMRGIVVPYLEKEMRAENVKSILEIGSGDGQLLHELAVKHPSKKFVGVDLNSDYAKENFSAENCTFQSGYALDTLSSSYKDQYDIIFASSTFVVFTPKELEAYLSVIKDIGVSKVILVDPITRKYSPEKYPNTSLHMAHGMWGHDYNYYFDKISWNSRRFLFKYEKHRKREEVYFQVVVAQRD